MMKWSIKGLPFKLRIEGPQWADIVEKLGVRVSPNSLGEVFQGVCRAALALPRLMEACRRPSTCHGGRWQA
jgi:hypothetical protein